MLAGKRYKESVANSGFAQFVQSLNPLTNVKKLIREVVLAEPFSGRVHQRAALVLRSNWQAGGC